MRINALKFPEKLEPFKGVILFAVVMMVSNFFWKYNVLGDEVNRLDSVVTFWGINISAPFIWMAKHSAMLSVAILNFLGSDVILKPGNIFEHTTGYRIQIVWACTGLKQAYIFFCILAFSRGSWRKKLWYIPLGLLIVFVFNIFRIVFIIGISEYHPEWFHFLHIYAFKYSFYGIIFLMWVLWEEKISKKKLKNTHTEITQ